MYGKTDYLTTYATNSVTIILQVIELLLNGMIELDSALYFAKLDTKWASSVRRQVHRKRLIKF